MRTTIHFPQTKSESASHKAIDERINENHKEIIITKYSHERIAEYKTPESRVNSINDALTGIHYSNLRLHTAKFCVNSQNHNLAQSYLHFYT
jgi:hypothetical protein